jgi:hypothetical protein
MSAAREPDEVLRNEEDADGRDKDCDRCAAVAVDERSCKQTKRPCQPAGKVTRLMDVPLMIASAPEGSIWASDAETTRRPDRTHSDGYARLRGAE